jgi:hypothetical protein
MEFGSASGVLTKNRKKNPLGGKIYCVAKLAPENPLARLQAKEYSGLNRIELSVRQPE